jgi:hypothetical protein
MKQTKKVGNWILEWESWRHNSVWVISNHRCQWRTSQSAIRYNDGTWGWDYTPDKGVREAVHIFMRSIDAGAYSVWVGGVEDVENVTIDVALEVVSQWQQKGYRDVALAFTKNSNVEVSA